MPLDQPMTPNEVAERLRTSVKLVLAAIAVGELIATDLRRPGSARPRWFLNWSDVEAWLASRRNQKPAKRGRRAHPRAATVTEYF